MTQTDGADWHNVSSNPPAMSVFKVRKEFECTVAARGLQSVSDRELGALGMIPNFRTLNHITTD